jgi:hypothetical protein
VDAEGDKCTKVCKVLAVAFSEFTPECSSYLCNRSTQKTLVGRLAFVISLRLKCDGTRAETRFRLSAKRTSPFKSAGASVQSTSGSRGVRISGSNAGYTLFRSSVKSTGYPLHSPVSPPLLPCVTVCHHISAGLYRQVARSLANYGRSMSSRDHLCIVYRHIYRRYLETPNY